MRTLILVSLLLVALSGCVDEPAPAETAPDSTGTGGTSDTLVSYEVNPDTANETELKDAHVHDEWGGATERILMDQNVQTADCADPTTTLFTTGSGVFQDREVQVGCATWRLEPGVIVPEGAGALRVELDATDALDSGGMQLHYDNDYSNFTALEATTEPVFTYRIEMTPLEWDLPHSTETSWFFMLRPDGSPSVLDGSINVLIIAEQMEDWSPILGSAHIDHWLPDAGHDFITPTVYRALDVNTTIHMQSFSERATTRNTDVDVIALTDIIAPGASQVTLAVKWDSISGCPAGHGCWPVVFISTPGGRGFNIPEPIETGENYAIYLYGVPDPLEPDSTYATDSVYSVRGFVRACPNGDAQQLPIGFFTNCWGEAIASMDASAWLEVEVWKGNVDMAGLKSRLGVA